MTIDREALEEIRRLTENLSGFVNEALNRELYRERRRAEIARLRAEGVVGDPRVSEWWREKVLATRRRRATARPK